MLRGQCIRCNALGWDPATACPSCGYQVELSLVAPTTFQDSYWGKHGVDVVTSPGTYTITSVPPAGANVSHFAPGLDLPAAIGWVACSGMIVQPLPGRQGGKESMLFCVGTTTGNGVLGATPRIFTGIRAVNLTSPTRIHFYPDDVDPLRDLSVQCPTCRTSFPATTLPSVCTTCGSILLR
jgi:hypothetical protein